jgi:hypothetical protein
MFGVLLGLGLGFTSAVGASAAASPPMIESRSVYIAPGVTILEADINPGGLETTVQFSLVFHDPCFDYSPPCLIPEELIPLPEVHLPNSRRGQHVSLDLESEGLSLGSGTYEYAVSATNSAGSTEVPFERFTAIPPEDENPPLPEKEPRPQGQTAGGTSSQSGAELLSTLSSPPPAQQGRRGRSAPPCGRFFRSGRDIRHRAPRRRIARACTWA